MPNSTKELWRIKIVEVDMFIEKIDKTKAQTIQEPMEGRTTSQYRTTQGQRTRAKVNR